MASAKNEPKRSGGAAGKVTKTQVIRRVASGLGMRIPAAAAAVEAVLECITNAIAEGKRCEFRDFGVFGVVRYEGCKGRDPRNPGRTFDVAPRNVVKFRPSRALREAAGRSGGAAADGNPRGAVR